MRTLVIMRHAKAEASAPSDFERELTDRGHAAATEAGEWLAGRELEPDYALVSSAARAQQTWEDLCVGAGWDLGVADTEEALYAASTEAALDLVREVDEGVGCLVLVGHNPTVASLVSLLDDGHGDDDAANEATLGFPPGAVAVLELDGEWRELDEASASLVGFHVGQG